MPLRGLSLATRTLGEETSPLRENFSFLGSYPGTQETRLCLGFKKAEPSDAVARLEPRNENNLGEEIAD
jgi:hypothetical protein